VTAEAASEPWAKTLKDLYDTGDDRCSTATSRGGVRASLSSSSQGSATPLDARKDMPRGSWHVSMTQTQLPSTTSTPSSALGSSRFERRAMTEDWSASLEHIESPRGNLSMSHTPASNTRQLTQTAPASFPPSYRRPSLNFTGTKRKLPKTSSSFQKWIESAQEVPDEKQIVERQMSTKKQSEKAVHSEGHRRPTQAIVRSTKGFKKVTRDHGELKRVFDSFDKDGSGFIETGEFPPLLAKLLKQPAETLDKQEVWRNWDDMDSDGNGKISFDEFLKWYCTTFDMDIVPDRSKFIMEADVDLAQRMIRDISVKMNMDVLKLEKLYAEFNRLDEDSSGVLEFGEFKTLVTSELSPTGDPEIPGNIMDKFWIEIDADGSGGVSFDEFVTWYMKFFYGDKSPMEHYYEILGKRTQ